MGGMTWLSLEPYRDVTSPLTRELNEVMRLEPGRPTGVEVDLASFPSFSRWVTTFDRGPRAEGALHSRAVKRTRAQRVREFSQIARRWNDES